ncbi:hypothetical protein A5681_04555 [Mycobacterium scrofulaceum]|uniref:hypothetical protein n=1 Tax=Mycobacterium scrofulaceum TaxID=1783 RepID=UPI0007FE5160|nr:hypothetical protein [Mycobacterium scrofulaceum]OBH80202.1 hypothetical protein A5681_04555 [Mycobacterium scrofulaceum]
MLYYANGGPGPAGKLFRVDAPAGGSSADWLAAPSARWEPKHGWLPYNAQPEILATGEMFLIDSSEVERVQQEMIEQYEQAQRRFAHL